MSAKVTEAINAVMGKVGYIQKKGTNSFHNYKFAAIGDVLAELKPRRKVNLPDFPAIATNSPSTNSAVTPFRASNPLPPVP